MKGEGEREREKERMSSYATKEANISITLSKKAEVKEEILPESLYQFYH